MHSAQNGGARVHTLICPMVRHRWISFARAICILVLDETIAVDIIPPLPQACFLDNKIEQEDDMAESVYKVIELIGTSTDSWEMAAKAAVDRAGKSLRDLRVAEVVLLDMQMDDGKIEAYRAKIKVSFKFEG